MYVVRLRHFTIVTLPLLKHNTSGNTDIMEENLCLPMRVILEILIYQKLNGKMCIYDIIKILSEKKKLIS